MKNKMIDTLVEKFKAQFMPVVDSALQMTMDGQIAVPTKDGDFVAINGEELTAYPAEMTMDFPVYVLSKKVTDVKAGDIIKTGNSYCKVVKLNKNNAGKLTSFSCLSYTGNGKTVRPITDFLMGTQTVQVVINMMNGFDCTNGMNPMMLLALKDGGNDMFTMMAMSQMMGGNNAMGNVNPMMFMLLGKNEGSSDALTTMMMMQMFQNGGMTNLFGSAAQAEAAAE